MMKVICAVLLVWIVCGSIIWARDHYSLRQQLEDSQLSAAALDLANVVQSVRAQSEGQLPSVIIATYPPSYGSREGGNPFSDYGLRWQHVAIYSAGTEEIGDGQSIVYTRLDNEFQLVAYNGVRRVFGKKFQ